MIQFHALMLALAAANALVALLCIAERTHPLVTALSIVTVGVCLYSGLTP